MWRAVLASCQLPVLTGEFDLPGIALPFLLYAPALRSLKSLASALAQGKVACPLCCVPLGCWPSDCALKAKTPESSKPSRTSFCVSRKLPNIPWFVTKKFFKSPIVVWKLWEEHLEVLVWAAPAESSTWSVLLQGSSHWHSFWVKWDAVQLSKADLFIMWSALVQAGLQRLGGEEIGN